MKDGLRRALANATSQLNRLTKRERALMAVMSCVVSIWWAVGSYNAADAAREKLADAQAENATRARLSEAQSSESFRAALAGEARTARAWAVPADTAQIAAIRVQGQLEQLAIEAGVGEALVKVGRAPPASTPVQQVELSLEGSYDASSFNALLAAMADSVQCLMPVSIEVDGPENRFRMRVMALYIAPGSAT